MTTAEALALGVLQGLTEFLPVSSSGHLALAQEALGIRDPSIALEVSVHLGTALAVILAFAQQIRSLCVAVCRAARNALLGGLRTQIAEDRDLHLATMIVWGTVPAALAGLLFRDPVERMFSSPILVSCALLVTGLVLWSTRWASGEERSLGWTQALWIGLAQAVALVPGISRSGATISAGLHARVSAHAAAEYSLLLSLPAILGATVLQLRDFIAGVPLAAEIRPLVLAVVAAFCSGYLAVRLLLRVVRRGRLRVFAYYCWAVGGAGLVWAAIF